MYRLDRAAAPLHATPDEVIRSVRWDQLIALAQHLGRVNAGDVEFDPTRRRFVNDRLFELL